MKHIFTVVLVLWKSGYLFAQCPSNGGWVPVSDKCMVCGSTTLSYTKAKTACEKLDGNLASILNMEEKSFAEACSPDTAVDVWFGLTMRNSTAGKVYGWLDGSPEEVNVTMLMSGATAPIQYESNCFTINGTTWEDDSATTIANDCDGPSNYVCSHAQVQCQALAEPGGSLNITYDPQTTPYYPRHVATYTCNAGYELDGEGVNRTCEDDGDWSGNGPACDPVDCGPLRDPPNGRVQSNSRTAYTDVVTYLCNSGYTLGSVDPSRICQANKTWSGSEFTCSPMDCGAPPALENAVVSTTNTTVGYVATYTCKEDYVISQATTKTCLDTGYWSVTQPICTRPDDTTAIAVGASVGGLAFVGLTAAVMYLLFRTPTSPALPRPNAGAPRMPAYPRPLQNPRPSLMGPRGPRPSLMGPRGPRPRLF